MSKIMIECKDANDLESLYDAVEDKAGRCNITYYKQHEAMVKAGKTKTQRESARKISEETGESEDSVAMRISRGKESVTSCYEKSKDIENTVSYEPKEGSVTHPHTDRGGAREGAGRPKLKEPTEIPLYLSDAFKFVQMAISQLDRIKPNDPKKIEALNQVIEYCQARKENE